MNNNVDLYEHNLASYQKIKSAYDSGEKTVGIVHATGTGKTYNALELAYENKSEHIVYIVPSNSIIEHIKKVIEDNPNLDLERDFPNLEFRTYQSLVNLSHEEIEDISSDLLIVDEFQHLGAPVWGARIDTIIDTHPNMKVFGMTAYTVRDRGTVYERDMANSETEELFSNKIVSRYDLVDAMIDGVLPKPIYKSAYINLMDTYRKLEERVQNISHTTKEYQEYLKLLNDIKKRIQEAPSIPNLLQQNIKTNGKYIYFCPPCSLDGTNDIETIKKQALEWFKTFIPESDIVFYTTTSEMGGDGKLNRDAFYRDETLEGKKVDNKLRIMFAINQYNEGVHAPNIDGVIMGRATTSDIVYFEQLGRALSVRGKTKERFDELENYSLEELRVMCQNKDIPFKENDTKDSLIEKLIAPVVIDLTNNYDFIKELENNLGNRIKEVRENKNGEHRNIKIKDASFDIEIVNQDLFEMLKYLSDRLNMTWEDYYDLATKYYEHHGNLEVPRKFKTNDGYTYERAGTINLGIWIYNQRQKVLPISERGKLLSKIGMRFGNIRSTLTWEEMYEYAKKYYEHHGNLEVPYKFKTTNGYTYDEAGTINLGSWITSQRQKVLPISERGKLLSKIGMRFENKRSTLTWEEMYEYAKKYYEHHGNLEVPHRFKTNDGYTYDEASTINLGSWISTQRKKESPTTTYGMLLSKVGMRFENKRSTLSWEEMYEYAKKYYEHHGNLEVLFRFKTNDGYTYDEAGTINLGSWISNQRKKESPTTTYGILLSKIGMRFEKKKNISWNDMYEYAIKYYEHHGNLKIFQKFKTNDGYNYDKNGTINLGFWISTQRARENPTSEKGNLLNKIGMIWNVKQNNEEVEQICHANGIDLDINKTIIAHISIQELTVKIEYLKEQNISIMDNQGKLIDIFAMSNKDMQSIYGVSLEVLIEEYYLKKGRN